ncbi:MULTISPECIES: VCBS repeat-containing protein [unclassified Nocardiopsis]|uniref:VCBS repeat-containing protein n=1 Tax=Nocardiopsis TaxID=2013 RepID=UPI00387AA3EA
MPRRPLSPPLLLCVLLATACGNTVDDTGGQVRDHGSAPVPTGTGSQEAGDVNGDGYPDLVFAADQVPDESTAAADRVIVVYGSAEGLDPATRTVLDPGAVFAVSAPATGGDGVRGQAVDLDGDGFADIPLVHTSDEAGGRAVHAVYWGGPTGPDPDAAPVPLTLPGEEAWSAGWPPAAAGDLDGDGATDLALVRETDTGVEEYEITALYGPFGRDGAPARAAAHPFPTWVGSLVAGPAGSAGDGGSPLLVQHSSDGEQTLNTLFLTGTDDPADWTRVDTVGGSMAAFGDLDGDGAADLVVGDDGNRNNEPGFETEPPEVHHRLNLYPGPLTADPGDPVGVDLPGQETAVTGGTRVLALCDTDGDGVREAAVGRAGHGVDTAFWADGALEVDDTDPVAVWGPEEGPLGGGSEQERVATLAGCADHDANGSDELLFTYSPGPRTPVPARWWATEDGRAFTTFDSAGFED